MDWTYNTIWYEQLASRQFTYVIFSKQEKNWGVPRDCSYYVIDDFKPKIRAFSALQGLRSPQYLEFNRVNITNFCGAHTFSGSND